MMLLKLKQFLTVQHLVFISFCTFSEPYDVTVVTPSVLNVIHGQIVPMDLVKVETEKECFFSFLSVGWGLMADIDIESERLRAIGEARFAVWGVIRALGKYKFVLKGLEASASCFFCASIPRHSKDLEHRKIISNSSIGKTALSFCPLTNL